ncbi:hypothetical protein [Nocardia grenadensis]|uniref:hypothetical protein n=1 Tax=Nocardia grenadensis TaxID=931537 RepID=UPI0007A3DF27|nr:hypothetical protein [Nocardia grenadensis]
MGIGDWFEDHWDDVVVGVAGAAGFALGGPAGAALVGGLAGGLTAAAQGEDFLAGMTLGAAGGLLGGAAGLIGRGFFSAVGQTALQGGRGLVTNGAARAIPGAFNGVRSGLNNSTTRLVSGMLGSGIGATPWQTDMNLRENYYKNMGGYPEVPVIDITDDEIPEAPEKMARIYMPDPGNLPYGLEFTAPMQQNYRTLPATYAGFWKSLGTKPSKDTLPKSLDVSDISGEEASGIPNYVDRVAALRGYYSDLRDTTEAVAVAVHRTGELCDAARDDVNASIGALKKFAGTHPRDAERIKGYNEEYAAKPSLHTGVPAFVVDDSLLAATGMFSLGPSEDAYVMVLVESALGSGGNLMAAYAQKFEELAAETEAKKPKEKDPKEKDSKQGGEEKKGNDKGSDVRTDQDPVFRQTTPADTTTDTTTGATAQTSQPPPALDLSDDGSGTDSGTADGADKRTGGSTGDDSAGRTPTTTAAGPDAGAAPTTPAIVPPAATAAAGMSSPLAAMMMPQMLQALTNRNGGTSRRAHDDSRDRDENAGRPGESIVAAPAAAPTPGQPTGQPATPAQSTAGAPPAKTVSAPAAAPVPKPAVARSEDNVVYTFPTGETQEVSAVVARALDGAFGNAAGTDARAAYTGTPAEWTDEKRIGLRIDPYQLMTGDVGLWEGPAEGEGRGSRTALLVVLDSDADTGVLQAVIEGELRVVTSLSEMSDGGGEFGPFVGMFHPPGIEKSTTGAGSDIAAAVSGAPSDQPAAGAVITA